MAAAAMRWSARLDVLCEELAGDALYAAMQDQCHVGGAACV